MVKRVVELVGMAGSVVTVAGAVRRIMEVVGFRRGMARVVGRVVEGVGIGGSVLAVTGLFRVPLRGTSSWVIPPVTAVAGNDHK